MREKERLMNRPAERTRVILVHTRDTSILVSLIKFNRSSYIPRDIMEPPPIS